ncbi:protease modulator HflC [Coralloluteibacterium stylophorae]|uniref:Protein HflC n=1 Tax=Coralloluteibacterium stylophorae TaxID=1776034 RepID=A0A8J7VXF7_9GAMM|nr:protease modulator HflC [Coralloluteibacterium stylophorae]MBS7459013.1 protease modulator HflC [Coralloluteibacterium stylophorae]
MKPITIAIVALVVLLGLGSMFRVKENEVGMVIQLGRIVRSDIDPGLHFKLPLVQSVLTFDRRIQTLESAPERYLTSEKKDVSVDFFVKWRVEDARRYYTATGGQATDAMQRLDPVVKQAIRNEINQRTLREVVVDARTNLSERFVEVANRAAGGLGIEVVDVRIKRIDLPEDSGVLDSVFRRMRAERTRVANELRAEGDEIRQTIQSEADRQRAVILAEAERDAQRLRGEGDAGAAETYAQAYGQDPEFYGFYKSLETYRESFSGGGDVLVLDPDSELMRYFEQAGQAR